MRIRSAHACKRASENEHTGRGRECDLYPEPAPRSASGRHGCRAGAACGGGRGGHRCSGGDGGSTNGDGGLRAASEYILRVVAWHRLRRDHRRLGSRRGRGYRSVSKRMTRSEAAWALQRPWSSTRGALKPRCRGASQLASRCRRPPRATGGRTGRLGVEKPSARMLRDEIHAKSIALVRGSKGGPCSNCARDVPTITIRTCAGARCWPPAQCRGSAARQKTEKTWLPCCNGNGVAAENLPRGPRLVITTR